MYACVWYECNPDNICHVVIVMWLTYQHKLRLFTAIIFSVASWPSDSLYSHHIQHFRISELEIVGHPGTFCLLFNEYWIRIYTFCIVGKYTILDAASYLFIS